MFKVLLISIIKPQSLEWKWSIVVWKAWSSGQYICSTRLANSRMNLTPNNEIKIHKAVSRHSYSIVVMKRSLKLELFEQKKRPEMALFWTLKAWISSLNPCLIHIFRCFLFPLIRRVVKINWVNKIPWAQSLVEARHNKDATHTHSVYYSRSSSDCVIPQIFNESTRSDIDCILYRGDYRQYFLLLQEFAQKKVVKTYRIENMYRADSEDDEFKSLMRRKWALVITDVFVFFTAVAIFGVCVWIRFDLDFWEWVIEIDW